MIVKFDFIRHFLSECKKLFAGIIITDNIIRMFYEKIFRKL